MYNREERLREKLIVDKSNKELVESFVNDIDSIKTNFGDLNLSQIITASEAAIKPSRNRTAQEVKLLQQFASRNGEIEISEASKSLIPNNIKDSIIDYANVISNGEREKISSNSSRSNEYDKGLSVHENTLTMLRSITSSDRLINEVREDADLAYRLADPIKNESPNVVKIESINKITKNRFMDFIREVNREVFKLDLREDIKSELKSASPSENINKRTNTLGTKYSK